MLTLHIYRGMSSYSINIRKADDKYMPTTNYIEYGRI
jgi:hypothetical protein